MFRTPPARSQRLPVRASSSVPCSSVMRATHCGALYSRLSSVNAMPPRRSLSFAPGEKRSAQVSRVFVAPPSRTGCIGLFRCRSRFSCFHSDHRAAVKAKSAVWLCLERGLHPPPLRSGSPRSTLDLLLQSSFQFRRQFLPASRRPVEDTLASPR